MPPAFELLQGGNPAFKSQPIVLECYLRTPFFYNAHELLLSVLLWHLFANKALNATRLFSPSCSISNSSKTSQHWSNSSFQIQDHSSGANAIFQENSSGFFWDFHLFPLEIIHFSLDENTIFDITGNIFLARIMLEGASL